MELLAVIGIAYALFLLTVPFLLWFLWQRVRRLADRLAGLERQRQPSEAVAAAQEESPVPTPAAEPPPPVVAPPVPALSVTPEPVPVAASTAPERSEAEAPVAPTVTPSATPGEAIPPPDDTSQAAWPIWVDRIRAWAFGGNMVARIGILVLFFADR